MTEPVKEERCVICFRYYLKKVITQRTCGREVCRKLAIRWSNLKSFGWKGTEKYNRNLEERNARQRAKYKRDIQERSRKREKEGTS